MPKLADFQVNQYETPQGPVIEDHIDPQMLLINGKPDLPYHKSDSVTQLEQKVFEFADQVLLQFRFGIGVVFRKLKKIQDKGVFDQVGGIRDNPTLGGMIKHVAFISGKA